MEENLQQQEVSLNDLRQRVNDKAEKMIKSWFLSNIYDILGSLLIVVLVIVFPLLNHFCNWVETDWRLIILGILVLAVGAVSIMILLRYFLNKMKRADSVSQQYWAAKHYMRTIQWGHFLLLLLPLMFVDIIKDGDYGFLIFISCIFLIVVILILYSKPHVFIDKDFYNDVEELGEYE